MNVKVRVHRYSEVLGETGSYALVYTDILHDNKENQRMVLANNGKWRVKSAYDVIFEDEKLRIEED